MSTQSEKKNVVVIKPQDLPYIAPALIMKRGTAIRVCSYRFSPTVRLNARIAALITVLMARFRITITNLCLC